MVMELRKHQEDCLHQIEENFLCNNKGLIKMFCGAGKSFIIYDCLLQYCRQLSILVVPSINLITQFNHDYMLKPIMIEYNKTHYNKNYNLLSICSKDELDQNTNLITTDKYEIHKFININQPKIILVTYQSLSTLIDIIHDNNGKVDIMCFDEAHHILGDNTSKLLFEHKFIDTYVNKSLFFTATPKNTKEYKMYNNLTEITIDDKEYTVKDDINEDNFNLPICGPLVYEYSHMDGVTDNILNDFNIRVELYSENKNSTIFETISRAILETGNNRVLTFHSRSTVSNSSTNVVDFSSAKNQKLFIASFHKLIDTEFPHLKNKYTSIKLQGIIAKTKDKTAILKEFDTTQDNELFILSSCKTIGEGIDTKNANMVCFIDPKQSYIEIIQNIGRICRKNKSNNLSTVLIPTYINIEKYTNCDTPDKIDNIIRGEMSNTGDFNGILSVLSALRQEDPYMFDLCLKYPNTYTNNEFKRQFKRFNLLLDDVEYTIEDLFNQYNQSYNTMNTLTENFNILSEKLEKNIKIFCKKIDEKNIRINNKYELDECFVKNENDLYVKVLGKKERKTHIPRPNRNIKPFVHANDKIKVLWNIDQPQLDFSKKIFGCYITSTVVANTKELWIEMYTNILQDDIKNIEKYSSWICKNKQLYKRSTGLFKYEDIKQMWETLKQDEVIGKKFYSKEELWCFKLEDFKQYYLSPEYKEDGDKPDDWCDPNPECKKYRSFGYWIDLNIKNYRKNKSLFMNHDIKQLWEQFMFDPIYYDLFKYYIYTSQYNIDLWKKYYNILIVSEDEHISKHVNNLTQDESLWLLNWSNRWVKSNNNLFETKSQIMVIEEIYQLWNTFIHSNKKILLKIKNETDKYYEEREIQKQKSIEHDIIRLTEFEIFLNEQKERTLTKDFDRIRLYNNDSYDFRGKNIKNKWLEIVNNEKYKKFCLSTEDNFYYYLNMYKKYYKREIKLNDEEWKYLNRWNHDCMKNYKTKNNEMSNDTLRYEYSKFAIIYKNEDEYRYTKCGNKTIEKSLKLE